MENKNSSNEQLCEQAKKGQEARDASKWEFFHNEGVRLFDNCRSYREAIEAFSKAISHAEEAHQSKSYFVRALVYYELADYDNVISDCTAAVDLQSNLDASQIPKLYSTRGMAYKHIGDLQKASADFRMAAKFLTNF